MATIEETPTRAMVSPAPPATPEEPLFLIEEQQAHGRTRWFRLIAPVGETGIMNTRDHISVCHEQPNGHVDIHVHASIAGNHETRRSELTNPEAFEAVLQQTLDAFARQLLRAQR